MFRGLLTTGTTRCRERRLTTLINAVQRSQSQQRTRRVAVAHLQQCRRRYEQQRQTQLQHADANNVNSASGAAASASMARRPRRTRGGGGAYAEVDEVSGMSSVQCRFDALVYTALCRFGPPLPAEFVLDNHIVTTAYNAGGGAHDGAAHVESSDLGTDGEMHVFHDEVALHVHELMAILRKVQPCFARGDGGDGDVDVPFSLLVRNCRYLRAYKGKVHYMRCLRRCRIERHTTGQSREAEERIVVSIGTYKMREHPSSDGLRQGPQQWLYARPLT